MRIMALIDGSIYTASVCDHAAWVAGRTDATLELMHVIGRRETSSAPTNLSGSLSLGARSTLLAELATLDEQRGRLAQERGRAILDAATEHLRANGVTASHRMRIGDLIGEVGAVEDEFDILVIGKRGEAADFASMHLGSNLERVMRSSAKPVLVASRAFRPIHKVVVAFDGGASSTRAVEAVARERLFQGLAIRLITVGDDKPALREKLAWAKTTLERSNVSVRADIVQGEPETVLSAAVDDGAADLLVMGSHGHSRVRHLLIGSSTTALLRSCLVPVMVYR
ncbi:universal stress protein [Acuticoccus sp. I52.16.1]|uniref:universal stress protein n=1 Tax=Acuticoccus sp. I52.16.1 TaxID=2928472 RepID=UPI001FD3B3B0|nr:universal stress protein [Acuticoccus sp. I52.16.1]UOM32946.1 universal stress protein [Acuticoccus sp. I52.16.1]